MKVKELLEVIHDDEMISIEDIHYNCLEIQGKRYLSNRYKDHEVICSFGERYKAFSTIGTTIIIRQ